MNLRKFIFSILVCVGVVGVAAADPLFRYNITKITDGSGLDVTQGKVYHFDVQGVDVNGLPATVGQGANLDFACNGGPCTIIAPAGGNPYQPDPAGLLSLLIRFDTAPRTISISATHHTNPSISGTLAGIIVQQYPDGFNIATPLNVTAGVPFPVTITATRGGSPVTSFRDTVGIRDDYIGDILTVFGSEFIGGVVTKDVVLETGDWNTHVNHVRALNSVLYQGQAVRASGISQNIAVQPAGYDRVILLFPGETPTPGFAPGKTGNPVDQIADLSFGPVQVYATDQYYNRLDNPAIPPGLTITFTSGAPGDTVPAPTLMISNPLDVTGGVVFHSPLGARTISAVPNINPSNNSQSMVTAKPGAVAYYKFTVQPDTSAPIGTGPALAADVPISVEIRAYDASGFLKNNLNGPVVGKLSVDLLPAFDIGATYYIDTDASTLQPDNVVNFAAGVATLSNLLITRAWNSVQITFADGVVPPVKSNTWVIVPGTPKMILATILGAPGEQYLPGRYPGNTGTPPVTTAGTVRNVELRVCDGRWNVVTGALVDLTSVTVSGMSGAIPKYIDVLNGPSFDFPNGGELIGPNVPRVTFRTFGSQVLDLQAGGSFSFTNQSSQIQVNPGSFQRMMLVGSGEVAHPGIQSSLEPDGKVGSIINQRVGLPFTVTVIAADDYWNPIDAAIYPIVNFNFADPNYSITDMGGNPISLPFDMGGSIEPVRLTLRSLNKPGIEVFDQMDQANPKKHQSISVNCDPGVLDHFLMTIPNLGVAKEAGVPFPVTVEAKDVFNNTIPSFTGPVFLRNITTIPDVTISPTSIGIVGGIWNFNLTVFAAGENVRIEMSSGGVQSLSPAFTVLPYPAGFEKLMLLLEGETLAPGTAIGKKGGTLPKVAGQNITATAYATDRFFNPLINISGTVSFASDHYADFIGGPTKDFINVLGQSVAQKNMLLRTAINHNIVVSKPGVDSSTSSVLVIPGEYARVQILVPGELRDPGTNLNPNGKIDPVIAPALRQQRGRPFTVDIYAVDNYWNVIPGYNQGDIKITASTAPAVGFTPLNNSLGGPTPNRFVNGHALREVVVGIEIDPLILTANDQEPPAGKDIVEQKVSLGIDPGSFYVIRTPASVRAGQTFSVTITLEDGLTGPIVGYNQSVFLEAISEVVGGFVSGSLNSLPEGYTMTDGSVTINGLKYDYVENIRIKVTDNFQRVAHSSAIVVNENGLQYRVQAPISAVVTNTFRIKVELVDSITGTVVKSRDHGLTLNVIHGDGSPTDGVIGSRTSSLVDGLSQIDESYTHALPIYVEIAEGAGSSYGIVPQMSSLINLNPGPYDRILIKAPGERHLPGIPSATGKSTATVDAPYRQRQDVPFTLQVLGTDQFWNVASGSDFSLSRIMLNSDDGSLGVGNPTNQGDRLVGGMNAFSIRISNAGDRLITVRDTRTPNIASQDVIIPVDSNYFEVTIDFRPRYYSGPPRNFGMHIRLMNGGIQIPANHTINITAVKADGNQGSGAIKTASINLTGGQADILDQTYSVPETVKFVVSDQFGNAGESSFIQFYPRQIKYEFEVPDYAEVNQRFVITVRAIDVDTNARAFNISRTNNLEVYLHGGLPAFGNFSPATVDITEGVGTIQALYDRAEVIKIRMTDSETDPAMSPPTSPDFDSPEFPVHPGALASIGISDFSLQSNETTTYILIAQDSAGNRISNQTLVLEVISIEPPGAMMMNGEVNHLVQKTDASGRLAVTFAPSQETNGEVVIRIKDGDITSGFSTVITVTVLGYPFSPARALNPGENKILIRSTVFLKDEDFVGSNDIKAVGGMTPIVTVKYRLDNGPETVYDPAVGIGGVFNQTREYQLQWWTEICYDPMNCSNPVITPTQFRVLAAIQPDTKLSGYPSPFNPTKGDGYITLQYPLDVLSSVEVDIYDLFGQKVWHTEAAAGSEGGQVRVDNRVYWFGKNSDGVTVANGGYIVRVKVGATGQTMKSKILVVK